MAEEMQPKPEAKSNPVSSDELREAVAEWLYGQYMTVEYVAKHPWPDRTSGRVGLLRRHADSLLKMLKDKGALKE